MYYIYTHFSYIYYIYIKSSKVRLFENWHLKFNILINYIYSVTNHFFLITDTVQTK